MSEKQKFYEDMKIINSDPAICIRCHGRMLRIAPDKTPGADNSITVHVCVECRKMEFYASKEMTEDDKT